MTRLPRAIHDEPSTEAVTVQHNTIYFYGEIDYGTTSKLIAALKNVPAVFPRIHLYLNSPGGDVFCGLQLADTVRASARPIYVIAAGIVASAASLPFVCCKRRLMMPSAFLLFHQPSTWAWGNTDDVQDEADILERITQRIVTIYSERSKLKYKKIEAMLHRNTLMDAQEAVQHGFADTIINGGTINDIENIMD